VGAGSGDPTTVVIKVVYKKQIFIAYKHISCNIMFSQENLSQGSLVMLFIVAGDSIDKTQVLFFIYK
jgi:hypothetical protein